MGGNDDTTIPVSPASRNGMCVSHTEFNVGLPQL